MIQRIDTLIIETETNGRYFADDIVQRTFPRKNAIWNDVSMYFYDSALIQVTAWCLTGAKPLPEAMVTYFIDAHMNLSVLMS